MVLRGRSGGAGEIGHGLFTGSKGFGRGLGCGLQAGEFLRLRFSSGSSLGSGFLGRGDFSLHFLRRSHGVFDCGSQTFTLTGQIEQEISKSISTTVRESRVKIC